MAEFSKELYSKLLLEVWEKVQQRRTQDGVELSLDELEDVAGGRDWMRDG